jgi:hypothetical protein
MLYILSPLVKTFLHFLALFFRFFSGPGQESQFPFTEILFYEMLLAEEKKMSSTLLKAVRTLSLILLAVFLLTILTVESHGATKGCVSDQLPTIVEEDAVFATINVPVGQSAGLYSPVYYLHLFQEKIHLATPLIGGTIYRGPPTPASL